MDDQDQNSDIAVIVTTHPTVDHELIAQKAPVTVNLCDITGGTHTENIIRL